MKYLTIDGVKLAYQEFGQGEPILFLHGFGETLFSWRFVAPTLSQRLNRRCICLDLMGFGASDKPPGEDYTLARQAHLVSGFITSLGLKSLSIVGHSYGGGISLILVNQLSTDHSFSVTSLVLVDSVCYPQRIPFFIKSLQIPSIRWLALKLISVRGLVRFSLRSCYTSRESVTDEAVSEYSSALKSEGAGKALIATAENIIPKNIDLLVGSYKTILIPTFILWGDNDKIVPLKLGKRLHSEITSSSMEILDNCGHIPQEERPEETIDLLTAFFAEESHRSRLSFNPA